MEILSNYFNVLRSALAVTKLAGFTPAKRFSVPVTIPLRAGRSPANLRKPPDGQRANAAKWHDGSLGPWPASLDAILLAVASTCRLEFQSVLC